MKPQHSVACVLGWVGGGGGVGGAVFKVIFFNSLPARPPHHCLTHISLLPHNHINTPHTVLPGREHSHSPSYCSCIQHSIHPTNHSVNVWHMYNVMCKAAMKHSYTDKKRAQKPCIAHRDSNIHSPVIPCPVPLWEETSRWTAIQEKLPAELHKNKRGRAYALPWLLYPSPSDPDTASFPGSQRTLLLC